MGLVRLIAVFLIISLTGISCSNKKNESEETSEYKVIQPENGVIELQLDDAYMLQDSLHPEQNTAEWRFNARLRGRYELWLTSLTLDTMHLNYEYPVVVSFNDKKIEATPIGNEIVLNSPDSGEYYFRADSKLGSLYIDEPGDYNIQLISDKVVNTRVRNRAHTKMRSLLLKPMSE